MVQFPRIIKKYINEFRVIPIMLIYWILLSLFSQGFSNFLCEIKLHDYAFFYKNKTLNESNETENFVFERKKDCPVKRNSRTECDENTYFFERLYYHEEHGYCLKLPELPEIPNAKYRRTEEGGILFIDASESCDPSDDQVIVEVVKEQIRSGVAFKPFNMSICRTKSDRIMCKNHADCEINNYCDYSENFRGAINKNPTCHKYPRLPKNLQVVLKSTGIYPCDSKNRCQLGLCFTFSDLVEKYGYNQTFETYYSPDLKVLPNDKSSGFCVTGYPFCRNHEDCPISQYCENRSNFEMERSIPLAWQELKKDAAYCAEDLLYLPIMEKPISLKLARQNSVGLIACDQNYTCPDPEMICHKWFKSSAEGVKSPMWGYCVQLLGEFESRNFTTLTTDVKCFEPDGVLNPDRTICINSTFVILGNNYDLSTTDTIECENQTDCDARLISAMCITNGTQKRCHPHPYNVEAYGQLPAENIYSTTEGTHIPSAEVSPRTQVASLLLIVSAIFELCGIFSFFEIPIVFFVSFTFLEDPPHLLLSI